MDKTQNLSEASDFICLANEECQNIIKKLGFYCIQLPRPHMLGKLKVDGNPTFEVVMNSFLTFIKLEALA